MEAVLAQAEAQPPDVALVDIGLPGMSGIGGIRRIKEKWPDTSPVMLTVHDDDERIMEALCAGANGYLLKNTDPVRLLEAIRDPAAGGSPMSREAARTYASRNGCTEPAGRRREPEDGGGDAACEPAHGLLARASHLRIAAGSLTRRSRGQGAAERTAVGARHYAFG
jgi:DNA-binding NarL/FixJ family response regulator